MTNITTTYSIDEFKEIQKDQKHPFLGLFHLDNTQIVPFNNYGGDPAEKLKEIEKALQSPVLGDGVYLIKTKSSHSKKAAALDYPIQKGEGEPVNLQEDMNNNGQPFQAFSPQVTSYQEVLKLNIELERLKLENEQQKKIIEDLEEALEEYEKDEAAGGGMLNEQRPADWQVFGEKLMTFIAPAMDKYFDLQDKKLAIRGAELQRMGVQPKPQPQQEQPESVQMDAVAYTDKKIQEWINSHKEDPEKFNQMVAVYNSAESMDNFFNQMEQITTKEEFNNLIDYINEGASE